MAGHVISLQERLETGLRGRYTVERELGEGGMAVVYLARDLRHERSVAVKVLRPEISAEIGADRFLREIKMAAGLTHNHIHQIQRAQQAASLLRHGKSILDTVYEMGYYDQPHMTRDFRRLAETSPAAWQQYGGALTPLFVGR